MNQSHGKNTSTTDSLNLSFGNLTEEFSLDDDGLGWKESLSEDFEETSLGDIDNGNSFCVLGSELS